MSQPRAFATKALLQNALHWFQPQFRQQVVSPIESHFPSYPFPRDIQAMLSALALLAAEIQRWQGSPWTPEQVGERLAGCAAEQRQLFKQLVLLYRRDRASWTESLTEKTFHLELTDTLEQDVRILDALVEESWFKEIEITLPLPRLKDFLPVQFIEAAESGRIPLLPRQYDEKFHILQAPTLFLPDLAHFRVRCEDRDMPLAIDSVSGH